jgi:hypothetical protein
MKRILVLGFVFVMSSNLLRAEQILIERGTPLWLQPSDVSQVHAEYYGQPVIFALVEDLVVKGKTIAVKGDTLQGEVLYGYPAMFFGFPEMVLVQFSYFDKGRVRIPIMKSVEIEGPSRRGWSYTLLLPTLTLSALIHGGAIDPAHSQFQITTIAPVTVDL